MIYGQFKQINMGFNYKLAEEIISCFNSNDIADQLDCLVNIQALDSNQLIKTIFDEGKDCFIKPNKYTLLHCFIEHYLYHYLMSERYYLLDELCDDFEVELIINFISKTVGILKEYGVIITDYKEKILGFDKVYEESDFSCCKEYKELITEIYDDILNKFNSIEEEIIEAVFYLLYNNKGFLFRFNQYVSNYVTKDFLNSEYFDSLNHIKRCNYLPEWLKRAIFYRDNGKCQHCGKDLSGLISINNYKELQFDHIIPLEQRGTNDATNFQLLCAECNLKKSGNIYLPNYFYQMPW